MANCFLSLMLVPLLLERLLLEKLPLAVRLRLLVPGIFCTLGGLAPTAMAHPFHTSTTEMDWNAQSGCWEVGMRLVASDLELALQRLHPHENLDSLDWEDAQTSRLIQDYIQSTFFLTGSDRQSNQAKSPEWTTNANSGQISARNGALDTGVSGSPATPCLSAVRWVGQETEGTWIWLYFELIPSNSDRGLKLVHEVLADVNVDQSNIVSLRIGTQRRSVQSYAQLRQLELDSPWRPVEQEGSAERDAGLQPIDSNN